MKEVLPLSDMPKIIERLNELTRFSRERDLNEDELRERQHLRGDYMRLFKANFRQQMDSTFVETEDGARVPIKDWHASLVKDADEAFNQ